MPSTLLSPVPLRRTSDWTKYSDVVPIPHCYGTVTIEPIKYRDDGRAWVLSEGPIFGPIEITIDGSKLSRNAYRFSNAIDTAGRSVGLVEVVTPPTDQITVKLIGKLDPVDGSVMTNPGVILHDFLARVAGFSVTRAQLDDYRVACHNAGIAFAGVLANDRITNRAQADILATNAGAVWSLGAPGIATLYPLLSSPATVASYSDTDLTIFASPDPGGALDSDGIVTALVINYAWGHVDGQPTKSLRLTAPAAIEKYGEIEERIDLEWIQDDSAALSIGRRLLAHKARPMAQFQFTADFDRHDAQPGTWISVNHPYNPANGAMFITDAEIDPETSEGAITAIAAYGSASAIAVDRLSRLFDPSTESIAVKFGGGVATITARSEDGAPLPGALITLDGVTRKADGNGQAVFETAPGVHTLQISAANYTGFYSDEYLISDIA